MLVILVLEIFLFLVNYKPGTFLVGWDNLYPELNFPANFTRNIFSVWQEYRGLGLLDGMAYAANLPHTLFLWILHFFLPQSILRYFFIFLMHFFGGLGMYFLLDRVILGRLGASRMIPEFELDTGRGRRVDLARMTPALLGAIFYLFNLATIQMFYAPLEVFAVHFAALPWLSLSLYQYLNRPGRRSLLILLIVSILALPQGFVPQIFLVWLMLAIFILFFSLLQRGKSVFPQIVIAILIIFSTNAPWLLPYFYAAPKNAPVILEAKINQMSSEDVYLKNKARGNLTDLVLLRGFMLDVSEYDRAGKFAYIMSDWRKQVENPIFKTTGLIFFVISLAGLVYSVKIKKREAYPFITAAFLGGVFLGSNIWGISSLNDFVRFSFPVIGEAFRFSFTKFSLVYAFSLTILFTLGLNFLFRFLGKFVLPILVILLLFYSWPAFSGNFLFDSLRLKIPSEYLETLDFFKKEDPNQRIATLPQPTFWSWRNLNWRYRGSGFIWYGLGQPTLDRAFDPWSRESENYYWEISYAINSKNLPLFENVLEKYQITWLLVDANTLNPIAPKALQLDELRDFLKSSVKISMVKSFGKQTIYHFDVNHAAKNYVSLAQNLPVVEPVYEWNNDDLAYVENGNYISHQPLAASHQQYYPFRSIFTGKTQSKLDFEIDDEENSFVFGRIIPQEAKDYQLVLPDTQERELIWINPDDLSQIRYFKPEVKLEGNRLEVIIPKIGGHYSGRVNPVNGLIPEAQNCNQLDLGKVDTQPINEDTHQFIRIRSKNAINCGTTFWLPDLSSDLGYLISVENRNLTGKSLLFWIDDLKRPDIENYLPKRQNEKKPQWITSYFIQPPMEKDGIGYSLHFDDVSIGQEESVNDLGQITVNPIPYRFLTGIKLVKPDNGGDLAKLLPVEKVEHPNPSVYKIELGIMDHESWENTTLVLSQAYHEGWKAYEISNSQFPISNFLPFIFSNELKDHVLVNNWANGWTIDNSELGARNSELIIVFWPQYLEYLGFVLMIAVPLILIWRTGKRFKVGEGSQDN